MFTRIGAAAYKTGLGNITELCKRLGEPQTKYKTIHVAGTNGKGSTSHMLATVLQQCGYKTGLYTSPHLKDFRERVRVNGTMISHQGVIDFVLLCSEMFDDIEPSFFEMSTALAFKHFADEQVDVAVIETGLGGRLDSTNIILPELCVITNIAFDHKDLLGDTLEKIAVEKAGIIKSNTPVVISQTQPEITHVFIEKAKALNAPIVFANDAYRCVDQIIGNGLQRLTYETKNGLVELDTDLTGSYQSKNIAGVLAACDVLRKSGYNIQNESIAVALQKVGALTGLRGRWEVLNKEPLVIADVAHNEDGLTQTLSQIQSLQKNRVHFVIGFVKDKDIGNILKIFPRDATYYFCKPDLPRGLDANELQTTAAQHGLNGLVYDSVENAYKAAMNAADKNDLVYVGGSTFVVAEII